MMELNEAVAKYRLARPGDREELRRWIALFLGLRMPAGARCEGHQSPLDYLCHSFFESEGTGGDAVVWACRGGGKTTVGAVATLLDLVFKPGVQIRILGGSFEQSEKMYATLRRLMDRHFADLRVQRPTQRRLALKNGSRMEVLAQSDRSVRGQRVQKLRCDEVELFDPAVWQAAQLTTRSVVDGKERAVRGALEVFSTMHRPGGLMQQILNESGAGRKAFAWCVWDVLEKCPAERKCEGCALWEGCQGRAKEGNGFVRIEDVITMKGRVSRATWEHEMLCHPPRFEDAVFGAFRRGTHVRAVGEQRVVAGGTASVEGRTFFVESVVAGVDFGYAGAFVCLWVAMLREGSGRHSQRVVWVVDELVTREQTVAANVAAMAGRTWEVVMVYPDVAGRHTNSQTGRSDERVLRDAGFATRCRGMKIEEGVGMISDLVQPAMGGVRLMVDPKCVRLIGAFEGYRRGGDGKAVKDGVHDHLMDALRYAVVNHEGAGGRVEVVMY